MTIDPDVQRVASEWNLDARLMQAVVQAEGDILKAVRCTYPNTGTREAALRILARSLVHRLCEFAQMYGHEFVSYFGGKWAPIGVANDPKNLNSNFVRNVQALWLGQH